MSLAREIGLGVIGCGYRGPKIVRAISSMDGARLAMVSDLAEPRLRDFSERYTDVLTTTDYRHLLGELVVVVVVCAGDSGVAVFHREDR